jgi:hypothetical protein
MFRAQSRPRGSSGAGVAAGAPVPTAPIAPPTGVAPNRAGLGGVTLVPAFEIDSPFALTPERAAEGPTGAPVSNTQLTLPTKA